MSKKKLHTSARGVVHKSKHRTRLRVPKGYRKHEHLHQVKSALKEVPGVKDVEVNQQTGSVLIHHTDEPDILEKIGEALEESAPEILACLLLPGAEEAEVGFGLLTNVFKKCIVEPFARPSMANAGNGGNGGSPDAAAAEYAANSYTAKRVVPIMFIAAGAWQLMQEEALMAGIAPIALFYYGFDVYWKLQQENIARKIEETATHLPTEEQLKKDLFKPNKEHA